MENPGLLIVLLFPGLILVAVVDHADGKDDKGESQENDHDPVIDHGCYVGTASKIACNDHEKKANKTDQSE